MTSDYIAMSCTVLYPHHDVRLKCYVLHYTTPWRSVYNAISDRYHTMISDYNAMYLTLQPHKHIWSRLIPKLSYLQKISIEILLKEVWK